MAEIDAKEQEIRGFYLRMEVRMAGKDPQCHLFMPDNMLTPITVIVVLLPQNLKLDFIEEAVLLSGEKKKREKDVWSSWRSTVP